MTEEIMDTEKAAAYLAISPALLIKFRGIGGGPRYVKLGRAVRYSSDGLAAWLRENERGSTSDSGQPLATAR